MKKSNFEVSSFIENVINTFKNNIQYKKPELNTFSLVNKGF